jgi:membrane protein DedA with SNARE-associated domain
VGRLAELLEAWGLAGVLGLAALDSAGVPVPAGVDALLVALAAVNPTRAYPAALLATAGSLAGNLFLFLLARRGGQAWLSRKTQTGRGQRLRHWFQQYGLITVFIPTVVPVVPLPLKVFVISAGALGVGTRPFALTVLAGRLPRYVGMAYLGAQLGADSTEWLARHAWHLAGAVAVLAAALTLLVKVAGRRRPAAVG